MQQLYSRFVDNYSLCLKTLKQEQTNSHSFVEFLSETADMKESERQSLKDFMILPIQRAMRYPLLFKSNKN